MHQRAHTMAVVESEHLDLMFATASTTAASDVILRVQNARAQSVEMNAETIAMTMFVTFKKTTIVLTAA